jgi:hypothetical protein
MRSPSSTGATSPAMADSTFQRAEPVWGSTFQRVPSVSRTASSPGAAASRPARPSTRQAVAPVSMASARRVPSSVATNTRVPSLASPRTDASRGGVVQATASGKSAGGAATRARPAQAHATIRPSPATLADQRCPRKTA